MSIIGTVQYPVVVYARVDIVADLVDGVAVEVAKIPQNATIVDVQGIVDVASDDTGTDTIDVGIDADPNAYIAAGDLKSAALLTAAGTADDLVETGPDDIAILATKTSANGDGTVGSLRLAITYLVDGRAHENQGSR